MEKIIFGFGVYLLILGLWVKTKDNMSFIIMKTPFVFGGGFLMYYAANALGWM